MAHTGAKQFLILSVRTEGNQLPIHLPQCKDDFIELLVRNSDDAEAFRIDLAAAHAMVRAGDRH